jgi:hypothetical protein
MNSIRLLLTWIGPLACILAIGLLLVHCLGGMLALMERRQEDNARIDGAAWLGLACAAVWLVCGVAKAGL